MKTFRFASHIHSSWSDDSDWTLPRIIRLLRVAGFDGALICDHDRTMTVERWKSLRESCTRLSAETGFLLVPGVEYQDPEHIVHVPVFGDVPFYGRSPRITDLLAAARGDGASTLFAHPARRHAELAFNDEWVPWLTGIEVWSRKYDGLSPNAWALEASEKYALNPFVSLDFHGPRQIYPLAMLLDLAPDAGAPDAAAALYHGRARASALGLPPECYGSGLLGAVGTTFESTRKLVAPRVRRLERAVHRWRNS